MEKPEPKITQTQILSCIENFGERCFTSRELSDFILSELKISIEPRRLSGNLVNTIRTGRLTRVKRGWYRKPTPEDIQKFQMTKAAKNNPIPAPVQKVPVSIDENTEITFEAIGKGVHRYMSDMNREIHKLKEELRNYIEAVKAKDKHIAELTEALRKVNEKLTIRNTGEHRETVKLGEIARIFKR